MPANKAGFKTPDFDVALEGQRTDLAYAVRLW